MQPVGNLLDGVQRWIGLAGFDILPKLFCQLRALRKNRPEIFVPETGKPSAFQTNSSLYSRNLLLYFTIKGETETSNAEIQVFNANILVNDKMEYLPWNITKKGEKHYIFTKNRWFSPVLPGKASACCPPGTAGKGKRRACCKKGAEEYPVWKKREVGISEIKQSNPTPWRKNADVLTDFSIYAIL